MEYHCVKSVRIRSCSVFGVVLVPISRIRSCSGPYFPYSELFCSLFPAFGVILVPISRIRSYSAPYFPHSEPENTKIRTRITPNTDTFHAVHLYKWREKCAFMMILILSFVPYSETHAKATVCRVSQKIVVQMTLLHSSHFIPPENRCFQSVWNFNIGQKWVYKSISKRHGTPRETISMDRRVLT